MNIDAILKRIALITVPVVGAASLLIGAAVLIAAVQFSAVVKQTSVDEHALVAQAMQDEHDLAVKAATVLDGANGTLAKVNAPCTGFHGSTTCGTLAQVDQSAKNFGIVAGQTTEQVKQSGLLIEAATQNMNTVGYHVSQVADSLDQTAKATTAAVNQANTAIASSQPLIAHLNDAAVSANKSVLDFNALLEGPDLPMILKNSAGITTSLDSMMARGNQVETKATQCYLYPTFKCRVGSLVVPAFQIAGPLIQAFK